MAASLLKESTCRNPNSSAGEAVEECDIEAESNDAAKRIARRKLYAAGCHPPDDFAICSMPLAGRFGIKLSHGRWT